MKLKDELTLKLATCDLYDVAFLMGYKKSKINRAVSRINCLIEDDHLGLYSGKYDFKYSDEEFLDKLIRVLGLDACRYKEEINDIRTLYAKNQDRFKSYVYIDTGFIRKGQPIFALALLESHRYIFTEDEILNKPLNEQIRQVQSIVKNHYRANQGSIGIWGDIKRYIFVYAKNSQLEISPDGQIRKDLEDFSFNKAEIKLSGKNIINIFDK